MEYRRKAFELINEKQFLMIKEMKIRHEALTFNKSLVRGLDLRYVFPRTLSKSIIKIQECMRYLISSIKGPERLKISLKEEQLFENSNSPLPKSQIQCCFGTTPSLVGVHK